MPFVSIALDKMTSTKTSTPLSVISSGDGWGDDEIKEEPKTQAKQPSLTVETSDGNIFVIALSLITTWLCKIKCHSTSTKSTTSESASLDTEEEENFPPFIILLQEAEALKVSSKVSIPFNGPAFEVIRGLLDGKIIYKDGFLRKLIQNEEEGFHYWCIMSEFLNSSSLKFVVSLEGKSFPSSISPDHLIEYVFPKDFFKGNHKRLVEHMTTKEVSDPTEDEELEKIRKKHMVELNKSVQHLFKGCRRFMKDYLRTYFRDRKREMINKPDYKKFLNHLYRASFKVEKA